MNSLLLVAHGSRRAESNKEIATVASALGSKVVSQYPLTTYAFLELAEPSIPEGIDSLIQQGATQITILPYFLSAGRHVHEDVPGIVKAKQDKHPEIKITIAPYLGEATEMIDVLASVSSKANAINAQQAL